MDRAGPAASIEGTEQMEGPTMGLRGRSALLIIDMQNDFLPGGALGISEGDVILPKINAYIRLFESRGLPIIATRDWHPPETTHFKSRGGLWPVHCVQGTSGAEFHPDLALPPGTIILSKGMGPEEDAYSAFQARDEQGRGLAELLRARGISHLYICGLALDYCVKFSGLDASREGFGFTVLIDATRAVNLKIHDAERAIEELVRAGAELTTFERLSRSPEEERE